MRRPGAWGVAAALAVCLGTTAVAADEDVKERGAEKPAAKESSGWFGDWFSWGKKPAAEKKPEPKPEKEKEKEPAPAARPVTPDPMAERAREEAKWLRRIQVCDELEKAAVALRDDGLQRQVEELRERARLIYTQRTASLTGTGFESDVQTLERHLGPDAGAPVPAAKVASGRAAAREVKP